jgi:hypothetical protein
MGRRRAEALTIHDVDELDLLDEYRSDPAAARERMRTWITPPARATTRTRAASEDLGPPLRRTFGAEWRWAG